MNEAENDTPGLVRLSEGLARWHRSARLVACEDALRATEAPLYCAHHERLAPATRNLSGCIVSPVRRPRLERGGRRFESCHPDHSPTQSIPTQLLTLHHGADAYSVGHAAVTRRSASSVVVRTHVAPPDTRAAAAIGSRACFKRRMFGVRIPGGAPLKPGWQWKLVHLPALEAGLLRVRISPRAPFTDGWQSGNAPVLKTEMVSEPGRVGSIPTPSAIAWKVARVAMGRLAKPRPAGNRRERSTRSPSASHERANAEVQRRR